MSITILICLYFYLPSSHLLELIVLEDTIDYILGKDHEIPLYASPEASDHLRKLFELSKF